MGKWGGRHKTRERHGFMGNDRDFDLTRPDVRTTDRPTVRTGRAQHGEKIESEHSPSDRPSDRLTVRPTDCPTFRSTDRLTDGPTDRPSD